MYRIISRLFFLLKATNQHGVHSPFVYNFVTKGLYKKQISNSAPKDQNINIKLSKKEEKILQKVYKYFTLNIIEGSLNKDKKITNKPFFIKDIKQFKLKRNTANQSTNYLIIYGIYHSKKNTIAWQNLIKTKEVSVSVDLFYFGLIFFKKTQAREHFKIRV